jgi:hypothetical protein
LSDIEYPNPNPLHIDIGQCVCMYVCMYVCVASIRDLRDPAIRVRKRLTMIALAMTRQIDANHSNTWVTGNQQWCQWIECGTVVQVSVNCYDVDR